MYMHEQQAQIVFLLSTLSEDNFVKNRDEIRSVRARSLALLTLPLSERPLTGGV